MQGEKSAGGAPAARYFAAKLAILFVWLVVGPAAAAPTSEVSLRWVAESVDRNRVSVEVTGLNPATLKQLRQADWKSEQWQRLLAVRVEQGDLMTDIGLPPMLGTYRVASNSLRFEPRFPLEAGIAYRATFQPDQLPRGKITDTKPVSAVFRRPVRSTEPTAVVTQIYPSASAVPENLLKFYVHFSTSMSGGHIYEHIHLLNDAGRPVEIPFLELDEELWNPAMTRLTLFIDPGRIKRGVKPLEEIGPSMEMGKTYTLVIDKDWKDSMGIPMKSDFRKTFQVGPPDREPPDPSHWRVQSPKSGTHDPLAIVFNEPMDHALAQRMIYVSSVPGTRMKGRTMLEDHERRWTFAPAEAWRAGTYKLTIQTTIEDLAGNNIGKPFEVDVFEGIQRHLTNSTVTVSFEVR
jgi:hypothetical protein